MDEKKIYNGLLKNKNNCWIAGNTKEVDTILLSAKALCSYGQYFIRETVKHGFECINTEDNFNKKMQDAIEYLRK
ncbi:MAG: hypothetical protein KAI72_05510 [Candidatus Pacebacteria bacterium]|nr:hypothetical protein [Candidatus Paceibacterota bacterium]